MGQSPNRLVEYLVPDAKALRHYARVVCNELAEEGDPSLASRDVVNGLATFMQVAGRIQVKYLNRSAHVDSPSQPGYGD